MKDPFCTHRIFNPVTRLLELVTPEQYQEGRSNPDKPVKDRSDSSPTRVRIREAGSQHARDRGMRQFVLDALERVKVVGYSKGRHPATTGTSRVGRLCATDGMGFCMGVAIGGEKIDPVTKEVLPGAKVRIFHIYPHNDKHEDDLAAYVKKLRGEGLTPRFAMHGGTEYDKRLAKSLQDLFGEKKLNVAREFYEPGSLEDPGTPLGVYVGKDNKVHFVTDIVAPLAEA